MFPIQFVISQTKRLLDILCFAGLTTIKTPKLTTTQSNQRKHHDVIFMCFLFAPTNFYIKQSLKHLK